jgi:hypothetical protein
LLINLEISMRVGRIDDPAKRMLGWLVRYSVAGRHTRKFFSDLVFGTSAKAKTAAVGFALEHLGEHTEIRSLRTRLMPRKNTPHGVPGVARYVRPGGTSAFWTAYWTQDGVRHQKKFSVALHGEQDARELAFSMRAEMTADGVERLAELLEIHAPDRAGAAKTGAAKKATRRPAQKAAEPPRAAAGRRSKPSVSSDRRENRRQA